MSLEKVRERGPITRRKGLFHFMAVEVLGDTLHISGFCPGNIDKAIEPSSVPIRGIYVEEYSYDLEKGAAEVLLSALREDFSRQCPPEQVILREFELARPEQTLHSYLEERHIPHRYTLDRCLL